MIDRFGHSYYLSVCNDTATFHNGTFTIRAQNIVHLSADGDYLGMITGFEWVSRFHVDKDQNIYVIGMNKTLDSTMYSVCKYNRDGILKWRRPIGENRYGVECMELCSCGDGVVTTGEWTIYAGQYAGYYKSFISFIDSTGQQQYNIVYDNGNSGYIDQIVADSHGGYYIAGSFITKFADVDKDTTLTPSASGKFIARYTHEGRLSWVKYIDGRYYTFSMGIGPDDAIYLGSWHRPAGGASITRFDSTGNEDKIVTLMDGGKNTILDRIKFDKENNLYARCLFMDSILVNDQIVYANQSDPSGSLIFKQNPEGKVEWNIKKTSGFDVNDNCEVVFLDYNILKISCDNTLGVIDSEHIQDLRFYPNPSSGIVQLCGLKTISGRVTCFSAEGRNILRAEVGQSGNLDFGTLSPGIYIIQLETQIGIYTKKLVIQR